MGASPPFDGDQHYSYCQLLVCGCRCIEVKYLSFLFLTGASVLIWCIIFITSIRQRPGMLMASNGQRLHSSWQLPGIGMAASGYRMGSLMATAGYRMGSQTFVSLG